MIDTNFALLSPNILQHKKVTHNIFIHLFLSHNIYLSNIWIPILQFYYNGRQIGRIPF